MKSLILIVMSCLGFWDYPQTRISALWLASEANDSVNLPARVASSAVTSAPAQNGPLTYLPGGPYRAGNTRNFKVMLNCQCQKSTGEYIDASTDITRTTQINSNLLNANGVLKTEMNSRTQPPTTFTPVGTYLITCKVASVILTAEAKKNDGQFVPVSINIKDLPLDTQIQNIDGVLSVVKK